jgi:hypothetical protein
VAVLADAKGAVILADTVAVAGFRPSGVSSSVDFSQLRENSGPCVMRECGYRAFAFVAEERRAGLGFPMLA